MDRSTPEALREGKPAAPPDPSPLSHREIRSIIAGIIVAMLLAALDQTIVATALPTIGRELGDVEHMPWVVTAYLLAATTVTPLYGKFSDTHGRRITLLIGIVTFVAGSIACAAAPTMVVLILARLLQGLGGGGLISLAQTIIADVVAPRERGRYQVHIASVFVASSLLGPVLGGFFAEHLHWSVIFWINLPLGALAVWMSNAALKRLPRHDRRHRLDVLGAVLLMGTTVTLLLALNWGGLRYPWISLPILGLVVASMVLAVALALRLRTAREPLIPLEVLRNPVVRTGTLAACFGMGTYIGLTIYVPVYFETVMGLSASNSGLALIPLMVGTVIGATLSGRAMAHVTHYKRLPMAGLVMAMAATGVLIAFAGRLSLPWTEAVLAAISLGLGTLLPVATVSIQNAVVPHQLGTATAVANFFRQLGGALIVAVFGTIVLGGAGAAGKGVSFEMLANAVGGADLTGIFRWVFAAALAGFALAFVFLALMAEKPLRASAARAAESAVAD
ncbi:MAG TPA: MDR family MFS transporter [Beijerinckiaceae bacterium]